MKWKHFIESNKSSCSVGGFDEAASTPFLEGHSKILEMYRRYLLEKNKKDLLNHEKKKASQSSLYYASLNQKEKRWGTSFNLMVYYVQKLDISPSSGGRRRP